MHKKERLNRAHLLFLIVLHTIGVSFYYALAFAISLFNTKYRKQLESRNSALWLPELVKKTAQKKCVFFYCCSAGEFEQAEPIASFLAREGYLIHFVFQSNSGIKHIGSLHEEWSYSKTPFDYFWYWKTILKKAQPVACVIIKHEFWPGFMMASARYSRLFVSNFTVSHSHSKWSLKSRNHLLAFSTQIFLATTQAFEQLDPENRKKALFTGDTKLDRCLTRKRARETEARKIKEELNKLSSTKHRIIVGSAYPKDVVCLLDAFQELKEMENWQIVLVPHRPSKEFVLFAKAECAKSGLSWTVLHEEEYKESHVVIVNEQGILFELYASCQLAFVGGGFDGGVHNTIEPYAFGLPVASGPNILNEIEAQELHTLKKLSLVHSSQDLRTWWEQNRNAATTEIHEEVPRSAVFIGKAILNQLHESNHSC